MLFLYWLLAFSPPIEGFSAVQVERNTLVVVEDEHEQMK
jgi:hypothetical protein